MNVGLMCPIAWDISRHAPWWNLYFHCGIEETGSPGIICIICHHVLCHPSEHGTSSMGKHLLAKVYIAKLNALTELEVSELTSTTVDSTALAIPKRQGSQEISIVSSKTKVIFDSSILSIVIQMTDKTLQTGSKGLVSCWISPRHLESLPHVRICFCSYSMEHYIEPRARRVVECIPKQVVASVCEHP